jgi:hypothetical protein
MKLRHFVSGSSLLLVGWLAVTFVYHIPAQRYQKSDKTAAVSLTGKPSATLAAGTGGEVADLQVSASR